MKAQTMTRNLAPYAAVVLLASSVLSLSPAAAANSLAQVSTFRPLRGNFASLASEIALARSRDPRAFTAVDTVVMQAAGANAKARGRIAPTARTLSALGPSALLPVLELLAVRPPRDVPRAFVPTVRRSLIEAAGLLRDARALSVLGAILEDPSEDEETTRTATEAVARIGTAESERRILTALDVSHSERTRAILGGMGECRRRGIVEALVSRLGRTPSDDETTARTVAKALGRAGNAWAWTTLSDRHEEGAIRAMAARALVEAFVRFHGDTRDAASNALMVIDSPDTAKLIAEASVGASAEDTRALQALADRFAKNPSRAR